MKRIVNNIALITLFILLQFNNGIYSQDKDSVSLVKHTPEFKFNDGVYLTFKQVKQNTPLSKSRIISGYSFHDNDFFERVLEKEQVFYYDENGVKQQFSPYKIWGYAKNGRLHINIEGKFNRITYLGSISHFVAMVTEFENLNYDPYIYRSNSYYGISPSTSYNTKEMKQFLLDFNSGKIFDFTSKSVEALLMQDPELYDEYNELKRRKQKKLKFFYIRKFNERNPLYIPK